MEVLTILLYISLLLISIPLIIISLQDASTPVEGERIEPRSPEKYNSVERVLKIKEALRLANKNPLPIEIIDSIIDYAEIWVCTSVDTKSITRQRGSETVVVARGAHGSGENLFVIRSLPIGLLPEQIDGDRDEFVTTSPIPISYSEPSVHVKSQTQKLLDKWAEVNCIRGRTAPCRKVVFTIWSHDQGFGGAPGDRGTFNGSYTWFDAGLERVEACDSTLPCDFPRVSPIPDADVKPQKKVYIESELSVPVPVTEIGPSNQDIPYILRTLKPDIEDDKFHHRLLPSPDHIIRNRVASGHLAKNVITWSYTNDISDDTSPAAIQLNESGRGSASGSGNFVRSLKVGDVVTLWAKARFPGWYNKAEYCKIDVYWAV